MPGVVSEAPPSGSTQPTNTLIVTQLPPEFFEHAAVLDALRDHFGAFGALHTWAPIRAFNRAILVYYSPLDAERVKLHCDGLSLDLDPNGCVCEFSCPARLLTPDYGHPEANP
jgi:calcipressin-2